MYPAKISMSRDQQRECERTESSDGPVQNAIAPQERQQVLLPIVPVRTQAGSRSLDTYALLDSGGEGTLIRQDAAEALGLGGHKQQIRSGPFTGRIL